MNTKTNATKISNDVKLLPVATAKENRQPDQKEAEKEIKAILNPTAEQRIRNMENFNILSEKFMFLKEKDDELKKFILSSDGTRERISMSNANGFTFEVTNTNTLKRVIQVINEDLTVLTKQAEKESLEFNI